MENFLSRLNRNPYAPIDGASVTRVDELGNGYDDWNNLIAPKFEAPEQTWGETALGVATAPARMTMGLVESLSPYGADGWQIPPIVNEGVNALTAVGDAYNYGMDQDEINSRALGMAGFMMGGGGIAARPSGSVSAGLPRVAAARYGDKIYTGANHGEAYAKAVAELGEKTVDDLLMRDGQYDGFLDETGDFIDRLTAQQRANAPSAHAYDILAANSDSRPAIAASGLDMSQEARLARARDMGFDTDTTWYHGSPRSDLETITPGYNEPGAWFTTDKQNAANYARGETPGLYETYLKTQNPLKVNFDYDAGGNLVPTVGGEPLDVWDNVGIVKYAQSKGFDSVHFPDGNFSESGNTMVVFDPSKIRSTNAAFDPAKSDSANLLAANADSRPALLAGAIGGEQKGITAYHGSPHDFDKFDLSKIGTGEGAQAYGHGLYFAENEGTAKWYKDQISNGWSPVFGGEPWSPLNPQHQAAAYVENAKGNRSAALEQARKQLAERSRFKKEDVPIWQEVVKILEGDGQLLEKSKGHMYQVRINAGPDDFLDLDIPFGDRPPLHQSLLEQIGSYPKTAEHTALLREAGVPGIKYLDQMSRSAGDGSRNYVVFDDSLIEILKKYGLLAPGAMYGGNALFSQAQYQQY